MNVTLYAGSGTVTVRYGTGSKMNLTRTTGLGPSAIPEPVTIVLPGLRPHQQYHYTVSVATSDGTQATGTRTLTTATAPVISSLRISAGKVSYADSEPATTTLRLLRCVTTHGKSCARYQALKTLAHHDRAGTNVASLPSMPNGRYELTVTPVFHGVGGTTAVSKFAVNR
jgi:hypothetical protein